MKILETFDTTDSEKICIKDKSGIVWGIIIKTSSYFFLEVPNNFTPLFPEMESQLGLFLGKKFASQEAAFDFLERKAIGYFSKVISL